MHMVLVKEQILMGKDSNISFEDNSITSNNLVQYIAVVSEFFENS